MIKKSTLAKKLASYSAMATSLFLSNDAIGQIRFTDVQPDTTIGLGHTTNTYALDLNGDGITDFFVSTKYAGYVYLSGISNLAGSGSYNLAVNAKFSKDQILQSGASNKFSKLRLAGSITQRIRYYYKSTYISFTRFYSTGAFFNTSDAYVFLISHKQDKTYLGWLRLGLVDATVCTIKSFAIDTIPGHSLLAGDTASETSNKPVITPSGDNDTLFCSTAVNYQWYFKDGLLPGDTNRFIVPKRNGIYNVMVKDSSQAIAISDPYSYKNCSLVSGKLVSSHRPVLCFSSEYSLDTLTIQASDSFHYILYQDSRQISTGNTSQNSAYTARSPGIYYAVIYDDAGCTMNTDSINLQNVDVPPPNLTSAGDTIKSNFSSNIWTSWGYPYLQDTLVINQPYWIASQNGYYLAWSIDSLGCKSPENSQLSYAFVNCNDYSTDSSISIQYNSYPGNCSGDSIYILFPNPGFNADSAKVYLVRNDTIVNGPLITYNSYLEYYFTLYNNGSYKFLIRPGYGCDSIASASFDAVFVAGVPKPDISLRNDTLFAFPSQGYFYSWFFNGQNLSSTNDFIVPVTPGNYWVVISDTAGCSSSSDYFNFTYTGATKASGDFTQLFSADHQLFIRNLNASFINGSLYIFNELGQSILHQAIPSENFNIDLARLPAGIYFVRLEKNAKQIGRKIVVQ